MNEDEPVEPICVNIVVDSENSAQLKGIVPIIPPGFNSDPDIGVLCEDLNKKR